MYLINDQLKRKNNSRLGKITVLCALFLSATSFAMAAYDSENVRIETDRSTIRYKVCHREKLSHVVITDTIIAGSNDVTLRNKRNRPIGQPVIFNVYNRLQMQIWRNSDRRHLDMEFSQLVSLYDHKVGLLIGGVPLS